MKRRCGNLLHAHEANADCLGEYGVLLALDYGQRRIGLARCTSNRRLVVPLPHYKVPRRASQAHPFDYITQVHERYHLSGIVLGFPLSLLGHHTPSTQRVISYGRRLALYFTPLPIVLYDERFSSDEADDRMQASAIKQRDEHRDSLAAQIILERFLNRSCQNQ